MKVLFVAITILLTACTPTEVQRWFDLHEQPLTSAQAIELADVLEAPPGWVDLGNGIFGPSILIEIRRCESGNNYQIWNRSGSSASGAYQFLRSSWRWYGHSDRYGTPVAADALPWQQDEAATFTWLQDGTRPWNASRNCWG